MQGYNFTERVRKVLAYAREEAGQLNHEYVGTEHILLGLLREGNGVASSVLAQLNASPEAVRAKVLSAVKAGKAGQDAHRDLPYTSRAKKVLELGMSEARDLGHSYVGTEHLLLGLLREEKGIGGQVLTSLGVTLERTLDAVLQTLGVDESARPKLAGAEPEYLYGAVRLYKVPGSARLLLTISAIPAWIIGVMLILSAKSLMAPMGITLDDWTSTIAQAQGAILLGLGFINWLARGINDRPALWAILYGNLVVQAVSFAIMLRALTLGLVTSSGFGALALHALLGGAFAWQAFQLRRAR